MKILASDFDQTLFFDEEEKYYHLEDEQAIARFRKAGHKFGVCTGRPLDAVVNFTSDLFTFDFYIVNSGARLFNKDSCPIYQHFISKDILFQAMHDYPDEQIIIMGDKHIYVVNQKTQYRDVVLEPFNSFQQLDKEKLLGFSFHCHEFEKTKALKARLDRYPGVSVYMNCCDIDVIAKGCSKKTGVEQLQEFYHLDHDDIYCIGDSYNDVPMLEAFNSFTFDYSPSSVQQKASHVVSSLAQAIDYILNKS